MFPIADESRWLVLTPDQAVSKLDGRLVRLLLELSVGSRVRWKVDRANSRRLSLRQAARLVGPTIFINDGPGPEGYLGAFSSGQTVALAPLTLLCFARLPPRSTLLPHGRRTLCGSVESPRCVA